MDDSASFFNKNNRFDEMELENTLVSASAQLSEQISGSFTAPSG